MQESGKIISLKNPRALSIREVAKTYPNGLRVLNNINLDIEDGDFFALLGLNVAGKSTLIKIICSLAQKDTGKIEVFGYDLDVDLQKIKSLIGLVPQEFNFNSLERVYDILINHAGYYGVPSKIAKKRIDLHLQTLGIWEKRYNCARELSGGMKRILMIIRAILHYPKLLILDEPTAGIDVESRHFVWKFLKDINQRFCTTIILTTHYLEEAEKLCNNFALIKNGMVSSQSNMDQFLLAHSNKAILLYLKKPFNGDILSLPYSAKLISSFIIELVLKKNETITDVLHFLLTKNIKVETIKSSSEGLESLFTPEPQHDFSKV